MDVDAQDAFKVRDVGAVELGWECKHRGVVHDHVDAPELRSRRVDHLDDVVPVRNVTTGGDRGATGRAYFSNDSLSRPGVLAGTAVASRAVVVDDDLRTSLRKVKRVAAANAATRASDQYDAVIETHDARQVSRKPPSSTMDCPVM